jgi:aspartyl-tRNA(Asn)/glutamyl-tRNA(Gln) amidotransferase subunit A
MVFETVQELANAVRSRRVSAVELAKSALEAAEALQPSLHAFLTLTGEIALAQARQADEELASGKDRGLLHGIPVAHKDLFCTRGVRTTSGSLVHASFVPDYDAAVVERLRDAGMVLIGKTNLHECAYGITSQNPHFGGVRNPWDTARIPGGSSGGSGAAVAAGIVPVATGSDTGGSIRIPASFCGHVGLKPTFGRVSKYGAFDLAYTLDHMGPMTRTVRDAAAVFSAMAGYDARDPYCANKPVDNYVPQGDASLRRVRIGVPERYFFDRIDPESGAAVRRMLAAAEIAGAQVEPVGLPDMAELTATTLAIQLAEAAAVHEPHRGRPDLYGPDVWALLERGRAVMASDHVRAQFALRRLRRDYFAAVAEFDALVVPTTPTPAPLIGQTTLDIGGETVDTRLATTSLVRGFNALGVPVLALPTGVSSTGLPLSCQIVGHPWEEATILRIGDALEKERGDLPKAPVRA